MSSSYPSIKPRIDFAPKADSILGETTHRGYRIVHTNDPRLVGQKDAAGFAITQGFVVLDEFDEPVLPPMMSWFYTPYDAFAAIEMREVTMPEIQAKQPHTSFQYEYGLMWQYRQCFDLVYGTLNAIQRACDESVEFEENPREEIVKLLHLLRQNIGRGRPQS